MCIGWLCGRADGHDNDNRDHHDDDGPSHSAGDPRGLCGATSPGSSSRDEDRVARTWICLDRGLLELDWVELRLDARKLGGTSANDRCVGRRALGEAAGWLGMDPRSLAVGQGRRRPLAIAVVGQAQFG
jgi:hypothetical protein